MNRFHLALLVVCLVPSVAQASPPAIDLELTIFGDAPGGTQECVAPCFAFFNASATTDAESTREFHQLDFRWDFGDPGSGTLYTGRPANRTRGPLAGHMYETPGTYQVQLTVSDTDGESASTSVTLAVEDPVAHFAGRTYCVTQGSSFGSWCPAGATQVGDQSSFSAALTQTPDVDGEQVWAIFNCGETWPETGAISLHAGDSPGLISSRGADGNLCANPPRVHFGQSGVFSVNDAWTVSGLILDGPDAADPTGYGKAFSVGGGDDGFVLHRVRVLESTSGTVSMSAGPGTWATRVAVWGSELHMSANRIGTQGSNMFWTCEGCAVMSSLIDNHDAAEFNIRFVRGRNIVLTDNEWTRPGYATSRNHIQIRGSDPDVSQNGWAVISRNLLVSHGNSVGPFLRFCRDAGCHNQTEDQNPNSSMENILVENNHMRFDRPVVSAPSFGMIVSRAGEITVRNNTFDLRGLGSVGGAITMCYVQNETRGAGSYDNVHCFNNTLYTDDSDATRVTLCTADVGSGHRCANNLVYTPHLSGSFQQVGNGDWQSGANVVADTSPFERGDSLGDPFLTDGGELTLAAGDTLAVDRGIDVAATFANGLPYDWSESVRTSPVDVGAHELGGTGAPRLSPPLAPLVLLQ